MIEATCAAVAPQDGSSPCESIIDPVVKFDQAAFDAFYGASAYPLAGYWEISLSPNLAPEPSFALMIGIGLVGVARLEGWRQRERGGPRPSRI